MRGDKSRSFQVKYDRIATLRQCSKGDVQTRDVQRHGLSRRGVHTRRGIRRQEPGRILKRKGDEGRVGRDEIALLESYAAGIDFRDVRTGCHLDSGVSSGADQAVDNCLPAAIDVVNRMAH